MNIFRNCLISFLHIYTNAVFFGRKNCVAIYHIFTFFTWVGGEWLIVAFFFTFSYVYISAGVVEWQSHCFATILLHYAHLEVTSVLVLRITTWGLFYLLGMQVSLCKFLVAISFGGMSYNHMFYFAASWVSRVAVCTLQLTFHNYSFYFGLNCPIWLLRIQTISLNSNYFNHYFTFSV